MSADDPVAEFLAREQSELAGLGDEFGEPASHHPTTTTTTVVDDSALFADSTPMTNGVSNGLQHEQPQSVSRQSAQPSPVESAVPRVEPETIKKWRAEQAKRLEKKGARIRRTH